MTGISSNLQISTSIWSAPHPNAGRNIQQSFIMKNDEKHYDDLLQKDVIIYDDNDAHHY